MKTKNVYNYLIIGGGISGISAAYYLQKGLSSEKNYALLESSNTWGGKINTITRQFQNQSISFETGADCLISRLTQALQNQTTSKQNNSNSAEMADRIRVMLHLLAQERELSARMLKELRELIKEQLLSDKDFMKLRAELRKSKRAGPKLEEKQNQQQQSKAKKSKSFHKEVKSAKTGNAIVTTQRGPSGTLDVVTTKEDDKPKDQEAEDSFLAAV